MSDEIKTTRKINIIVAIEIFCNADQQEVIEQCNYTFGGLRITARFDSN